MQILELYANLILKEMNSMPTYVLLEDIFEEMSRNISYIKLNTYLKKEKKI